MGVSRAAVARRIGPRLMARLERRLRGWPRRVRVSLERYLPAGVLRGGGSVARSSGPLWLQLPAWLAAAHDAALGRTFVSDVQWGQYCLFLHVRIHDDLFDAHVTDPALIYVGDLLLVEAERAFAKHLGHGPFWPFYRDALATTLTGILDADTLQRRPRGLGRGDASVYARVSSIFKVGAAAVCFQAGRRRDLTRVCRFLDHLAIASQVLDDLMDLRADRADGRRNYVASALARSARGLDASVADMRRHLEAARVAITPLHLAQAEQHVRRQLRAVEVLEAGLHRMAVGEVFAPRVQNRRRATSSRSSNSNPSTSSRAS